MQQYLDGLEQIMKHGVDQKDRTGVGTRSIFGYQMRFNLQDSFPAVTTKKLAWKAVVSELLWFLEGSGDERRLAEILHGTRDPNKKTIWTGNAQADYWKDKARFEGDLGRVYGVNWRFWQAPNGQNVDQVARLIEQIKKDPYSRRHILTAWNVGELEEMALPPCHVLSQFYVRDGKLSCHLFQRSADFFLGIPFNIASYSLFTHMIAHVCDLEVGEFLHTITDAHIYHDHFDAVNEQLKREPLPHPQLLIKRKVTNIDDFKMDDFELVGYKCHDKIEAKMAV
jgi:thymidylate synthase